MLNKKNDKRWSHSLFERSHFVKRYWFVEALVILVFWLIVLYFSFKNKGDGEWWIKWFSWMSMHVWLWPKVQGRFWAILPGVFYMIFVVWAIFVNVYKRVKVCSSLSCYLGETDEEKFKEEKKVLNLATGISSFGLVFAVPIIYFLSFLFRIIFLSYIRAEERKKNEEII